MKRQSADPIDTPPNTRLEEIFAHAAAFSEAERAAWLDAVCAGQPELRAEVEELLHSHDAEGFMKGAQLSPEIEAELARLKPEEAGERIGNYKLLEQLGEGGFGTVWVAEQEQPVRRRVALKIIKLGMDTKEVIARFEQERQALAMMDHPNIAKVFDAGATPFGRPFFALELVRGIKITDYCDQAKLSTADRLELFITVCQAVQHAHQKGIIHRDLKPSNILVTLHDGAPVPKVIDFGVAKATQQQRLTDLTIYTQFEQMIGTPLYMSPEQAEMSGLDVDTRSDIYSLGVLLYELLIGRTPFDPKVLMEAGLDEIRRVLREEEPPKPSTALHKMAPNVLTDVARNRQSEPPRLIHALRGDLDWIVMKALEKDRARRYETANGFAQDVQRHLRCEPVVARPPSGMYRFGRLVRRNQLLFAATGAVTATLLIGLSAVAILLIENWQMQAVNSNYNKLRAQAGEAERRKALEPVWAPAKLDETLASTARASALNPQNSLLLLQTAVLQLWLEKTGDHLLTCQRALKLAASTGIARDAERAAKIYCLLPSSDPQLIETALTLIQGVANVSQESPNVAWSQLTLGMAEYRRENYLAADRALEAAIQASAESSSPTHVYAMAGLFRAMSLLRQDKADDARRWFSQAAAKIKPMPAAEKDLTASDANHDDLILWLVYKEAKALIEPEK